MNKFETRLSRWNFKKIGKAYLIILLVAVIGCAAATGIVFRQRISFAWKYSVINEKVEKQAIDSIKGDLDNLASSSEDIVDILILDKTNNVVYSSKNSVFSSGTLDLTNVGKEKKLLASEKYPDVVFKYVKGEEFMLNSLFNKDFRELSHEYDEDYFYDKDYSNKDVYMLNYLGKHSPGEEKIYVIGRPTAVQGGDLVLNIDAAAAIMLFMAYWVLLALLVFQNAAKANLYPAFWGLIVLFTNIVGAIVYGIYKKGNATCSSCGTSQSRFNNFCFRCGEKIGSNCKNCGAHVSSRDVFCPKCGTKL